MFIRKRVAQGQARSLFRLGLSSDGTLAAKIGYELELYERIGTVVEFCGLSEHICEIGVGFGFFGKRYVLLSPKSTVGSL